MRLFEIDLHLRFEFFMLLSILLIADRTNLLSMMLLFIILHELGHLMGFILCGIKIKSISLELFGVRIKREAKHQSLLKEIFIYFAGGLANLFVAVMIIFTGSQSQTAQMAITINLVMMIFNLLPIGTLDGGNILKLLLTKYTSIERFEWIFKLLSLFMLTPLFILAVYLFFSDSHNPTLLITCFYLLYTSICG